MPRPRRNIIPNRIYLVSQEGNKKHPVYIDHEDREFATRLLRVCSLRYGVKVLAFGYGRHEGRWLLRPSNPRGLSSLMRDMQSIYSRYLNQKYDHRPCCAYRRLTGDRSCHQENAPILNSSNWTARFKAIEIDPEYFYDALAHVRSVKAGVRQGQAAFPNGRPLVRDAIGEALQRSRPLRRILAQWQSLPRNRSVTYSAGRSDA